MPEYFSEVVYGAGLSNDFIEIAVENGTDVTNYRVIIYGPDGNVTDIFNLEALQSTDNGHDVYVIEEGTQRFESTEFFEGLKADDAIALVGDDDEVLQFISWSGNVVTANGEAPDGMESSDVGERDASLQSDDGGQTYYAQSESNKGAIPACYAPGTVIQTPIGPRLVEHLRVGDQISTADNGAQTIRWIWDETAQIEKSDQGNYPVLIKAGALAKGMPSTDLIVSSQHRILVGGSGPLKMQFPQETFVPAKALTRLPGIRYIGGKSSMRWIHFSCDKHEVVRANGCLSESLLLGPMVVQRLPRNLRNHLRQIHDPLHDSDALNGPLARPSLTVGQTQRRLTASRRIAKRETMPANHIVAGLLGKPLVSQHVN